MANADRQLELRTVVLDGGLSAEVVIEPGTEAGDITPELIIASLMQAGVEVRDPASEQYKQAAEAARRLAESGGRVVTARGLPPDHGKPGELRFAEGIDPTADGQRASVLHELEAAAAKRSGGADKSHYERAVFLMVSAGQHVATVVPPTPGTEGRDVRGQPLACKIAVPADVDLDDSLVLGDDGRVAAAADGILCYERPKLRVRSDIDIPGCVDFSTGRVDGPRDVRVRKAVRSCFSVRAKRDLRVDGLVEAATLVAGRDAMLDTGMAAKEQGGLTAGRDVRAKYLSNVTATAGRDLTVDCEMVNCRLSTGRSLRAGRATVAGGSIIIGGGCEIGTLGSASAKTSITLGSLPQLFAVLTAARRMLPQVQERLAKAESRLAQIEGIKGKLSHTQAEELTELEFGSAGAKDKAEALAAKLTGVCQMLNRLTAVDLIVNDKICERTVVCVDDLVADFHTAVQGPVRLELGSNGKLQLTDLTSKTVVDLKNFAKVTVDTGVVPFRGKAA